MASFPSPPHLAFVAYSKVGGGGLEGLGLFPGSLAQALSFSGSPHTGTSQGWGSLGVRLVSRSLQSQLYDNFITQNRLMCPVNEILTDEG